jgi:RNA polymerase sigma factor (sigma-70 family)
MAPSVNQVLAQMQRWTVAPTAGLADAVLLERYVQERDHAAFSELAARYGGLVMSVCRRILGDGHQAEDAFQAAFLVLARKAASVRRPEALAGWLHSVARRTALKARSQANERIRISSSSALDDTLPDPHPDPLTQLTARELLDVVDEEVQRLPIAQRSVVLLCCLEGHTREESARRLGWTQGAVKNHLQRGRRRLQDRLRRRGIALSAALAVVTVSRGEAAAALLLRSTVHAALNGGLGRSATALAHSVLRTIFLGKLARVSALVLTLALTASATVALVYRGPATEAPEDKTLPVSAARKPDGDSPQARTDAHGDPLPDGAIARLGSQRLRHAGGVPMLTFTPDGKNLVSQSTDGVRVWDTGTGKELHHVAPKAGDTWGHSDLSPDGKLVAVSGHVPAGPIELWEVNRGKRVATLGKRFYLPVRFSPDGKLLATSSQVTHVDIWDLASRKQLRSWEAHPMQVWTIAFSADSRRLLTSGTTGEIRLWDVETGRQLQEFKPLDWQPNVINTPNSAVLSPDTKILALIESNEKWASAPDKVEWKARISLRETATGKQVRLLTCTAKEINPGHASPFTSLLFRCDGKKLITGGPDEFLREWDVATGAELRRILLRPGRPSKLAISVDEKHLAAAMAGATSIRLVDLVIGKEREERTGHYVGVGLAILTSDGRTAITGNFEGFALVWDVARGKVLRRFDEHRRPLLSLQLAPDGRTVFSNSYDNHLRVWDIQTGKQHRELKINRDLTRTVYGGLVVARDGKTVAFVDASHTIRVLDAETGQ